MKNLSEKWVGLGGKFLRIFYFFYAVFVFFVVVFVLCFRVFFSLFFCFCLFVCFFVFVVFFDSYFVEFLAAFKSREMFGKKVGLEIFKSSNQQFVPSKIF